MRFRFLGTGTSVGVPQIGCGCRVCRSADPRDRRRRCGVYVRSRETGFLIDTPPELRMACVEYGISRVDAVVLTHAHMDHVAGFDDVRRFNTINGTVADCRPDDPGANGRTRRHIGKVLPCYAMAETEAAMHRIFPYIGVKAGENGLYRPQVEFRNEDRFTLGRVEVERFRVGHGFPCAGYLLRQGADRSIAYVSDCSEIPDEAVEMLRGVGTLVIDCLRERVHPTHLNLDGVLDYVGRIAPQRTYLTHMCHDFSHRQWLRKLPKGIEPAYDGLELGI